MTGIPSTAGTHPHVALLRAPYADLPKLADHAADDMVLHRADRSAEDPRVSRGVRAVLAHGRALVRLTRNTLVMDVQHIMANNHFGVVLGILRAACPRKTAMPFCGLWRFEGGRVVEHWENAHDPARLQHLLTRPEHRVSSP